MLTSPAPPSTLLLPPLTLSFNHLCPFFIPEVIISSICPAILPSHFQALLSGCTSRGAASSPNSQSQHPLLKPLCLLCFFSCPSPFLPSTSFQSSLTRSNFYPFLVTRSHVFVKLLSLSLIKLWHLLHFNFQWNFSALTSGSSWEGN